MAKRIEVEQKFFCKHILNLQKLLLQNGFKKIKKLTERDEYFTDINSAFIKNRTCLRLRVTNNSKMELTFKGQSSDLNSSYAKRENNIPVSKMHYNDIVSMLFSLGFYSYSIVNKQRQTYSKKQGTLIYNVMIDELIDIGSFIEFEILSSEEKNIAFLMDKLDTFTQLFKELKLVEAHMPYRDFVAQNLFNKIKPAGNFKAVCLDLDGTLINSEKVFFESYKKTLSELFGVKISKNDYKTHELEKNAHLLPYLKETGKIPSTVKTKEVMNIIYKNYEKNFISLLSSQEVLFTFSLLKQLKKKKIKVALVTTCKKHFLSILFDKLDAHAIFDCVIAREDVKHLKPAPDAYLIALKKLHLSPQQVIAIEDSERGIKSALKCHIKTIQTLEYNSASTMDKSVPVDKTSRILLTLINFLENK